jgi:hypothetical protein
MFLLPLISVGANFISSSNGDWSNVSTWVGSSSPASNQTNGSDVIIINSTVTLNGDLVVKAGTNITVDAGDTLIVNGNVTFKNGSSVTANGVLIVNGNVTNNNNSNDINVNGKISINGNYSGGNGSELNGTGEMDVTGDVITEGTGSVFDSTCDCDDDCDNSDASNLDDDCNPLPVELISFECDYDTNMVITWATASEINNNYFILEHSIDGINWTPFEFVSGHIYSTTIIEYSTVHKDPNDGPNYYRITQVDFDGTKDVSHVINCVKVGYIVESITYYSYTGKPVTNPTTGFYLKVTRYTNGKIVVKKIYLTNP